MAGSQHKQNCDWPLDYTQYRRVGEVAALKGFKSVRCFRF